MLDRVDSESSKQITLPETNSSHLKMDGWKLKKSFWDALFSGGELLVSGRVIDVIVFLESNGSFSTEMEFFLPWISSF